MRRVHASYRPTRIPRAVYQLWGRRLRLRWWVRLAGWLVAAALTGFAFGYRVAPLGIVVAELVVILWVAYRRRHPSA